MAYQASMRVWRGDYDGGAQHDYSVEVYEGEVVLDIIHRLQQTQTPDLAVRWNCKAGKCGSCSAEINGRPRLLCMTRMSTFAENETIAVTPLRTFPIIRDLVTDVSFNYEKAREIPSFTPPKDLQPGEYRMMQEDVNATEFRGASSASCARTPATWCVTTRRTRRRSPSAVPDAAGRARHAPDRHARSAPSRHRTRTASASATSPSAVPRSAPRTSRSPTMR
jgi:succinate dehydrogenase/fumarate reductase iron-sulfur protein